MTKCPSLFRRGLRHLGSRDKRELAGGLGLPSAKTRGGNRREPESKANKKGMKEGGIRDALELRSCVCVCGGRRIRSGFPMLR